MGSRNPAFEVEDISRDLDLVVYKLERAVECDADKLMAERRKLRRELESLRDRLADLARGLE